MSKIFSCEFKTAKELYWIVDELKTMGSSFKVQFEFANKSDLEQYRVKKFKHQVVHQPESEEESDEEEEPKKAPSTQDEEEDEADARSTSSKDSSFTQALKKTNNCYIYQLDKPIMYFYARVYEREIKQLCEQFNCKIDIVEDMCTVQGDNIPFKQVIGRLRSYADNILLHKIGKMGFYGIRDSKLVRQMLADKNIQLGLECNGYYWARKEDVSQENFQKAIIGIQTTYRQEIPFWGQLDIYRRRVRDNKLLWLFHIMRRKLAPKIAVLEKLYEVRIEECEQIRGYIIHADTEILVKTIHAQIAKLFNKLFIFSMTMPSQLNEAEQLQNYLKRNCPKVEAHWGTWKLGFCMSVKDIRKNLPKIFTFMTGARLRYKEKTRLYLHASHYDNSKVAKTFLSTYKLEHFREVDARRDNIIICKPFDLKDLERKFLEIIEVYGKFIQEFDFTGLVRETEEQKADLSIQTERLDVLDVADYSLSMPNENTSILEVVASPPDMRKVKKYNLQYPLAACEQFEGEDWRRVGKRDKQVTELLQNELDRQFTCKYLLYNSKVLQPKLSEDTLLYSTDEEFLSSEGAFFEEIKLREITKRQRKPILYLVQAVPSTLVRNEDGSWTAQKNCYIPTHQVIEVV